MHLTPDKEAASPHLSVVASVQGPVLSFSPGRASSALTCLANIAESESLRVKRDRMMSSPLKINHELVRAFIHTFPSEHFRM